MQRCTLAAASGSSQLVVHTWWLKFFSSSNLARAPMGSAFDKLLVLWTLCALTTLLCGVFLGVLYHLLGQQIFAAAALHTLVVSVIVWPPSSPSRARCASGWRASTPSR